MEVFYPGEELKVICFFHGVPVREKVVLLSVKEDLFVWKASLKFLAVIAYSREFLARVGSRLFQFEILSIDDKEATFTTEQPQLINEEILRRQTLRVTTSEEYPVKLSIGDRRTTYGERRNSEISLAYLPCEENSEENDSRSLVLNVHDISVGGAGLLFKRDVKLFKPGKKIRMKLIFFRKTGRRTEIKEKEIPVLGEIVRKEKIAEDVIKVGIRFVDLKNNLEHYRFVFYYIVRRQREIRKQMECLIGIPLQKLI